MAGRIPELRDLEEALFQSADEASCANALREYKRRGGLNIDSAEAAYNMRVAAIRSNGSIEHYGRGGLGTILADMAGGGTLNKAVQPDAIPSEGLPPATAIQRQVMTAAEMGQAIADWNALAQAIEKNTPGAVKNIEVRGVKVPYRTATFWRAMRLAHNLEVTTRSKGSDSKEGTARAEVEVGWHDGKRVAREAHASRSEKGKSESPMDFLAALAWTRAVNRATRELVGLGETEMSAEEVDE